MHIKRDKKKTFCTSSGKCFQKCVKNDNNWAGHSVVKPVDAESFQRIKHIKQGGDNKNYDFDMDILEEGALEKALNVKKKTPDEKNPWKTINEVIDDDYFDE